MVLEDEIENLSELEDNLERKRGSNSNSDDDDNINSSGDSSFDS